MEFLNNYLEHIAQTPSEYYHDFNQAVVDGRWDDTTQIRKVKEQIVQTKPFAWTNEFKEYDAWVDTVSDLMVQYNKVYSDFLEILPKDVDHPQNYRGQYYKLALDNENEETYLCYDTINNLEQLPNFKVVRCNNVLTMLNEKYEIVQYPCYLGVDISSTNDFIAKSGIVPNTRMIIMVQVNDDTRRIVNNQRFMFEHNSTFEVEEINNFMREEGTDGQVTIMRIYVKYSTILPRDNKELNLCDYHNSTEEIIENPKRTQLYINPIKTNIKLGKTNEITYMVKDEDEQEVIQPITYEFNWSDDSYYTFEDDGVLKITNHKVCGKPLTITFKSDNCEDIDVTVWLVNKF